MSEPLARLACLVLVPAALLLGWLAPSAGASLMRPGAPPAKTDRARGGAAHATGARNLSLSSLLGSAVSALAPTDTVVSGTITASVNELQNGEFVQPGETLDTSHATQETSITTTLTDAPLTIEEEPTGDTAYRIHVSGGVATATYQLHATNEFSEHVLYGDGEERNLGCSETTVAGGVANGDAYEPEAVDEIVRGPDGKSSVELAPVNVPATSNGTCEEGATFECRSEVECHISGADWGPCHAEIFIEATADHLTGQCTFNGEGNAYNKYDTTLTLNLTIAPSQPPDVTLQPASDASGTSATLHGTVNPEGSQITECLFEYGTSQSYGSVASCSPEASAVGAGSDPVDVSAGLDGLQQGATYYYKIVASNGAGMSVQEPGRFTLSPPEVGTEPADPIEGRAASLNGVVNSHGLTLDDCVFHVYDTATFAESEVPCSDRGDASNGIEHLTGDATALTPGTLYVYRLVASNGVASAEGADQEFTTPGPPVVTTGPASQVTSHGATLEGSVDPNGGEVVSCEFHVSSVVDPDGFDIPCVPASIGAGRAPVSVSAEASTLEPDTIYSYKLVAVNETGVEEQETGEGYVREFTTVAEPTVVTSAPEAKARSATLNGTVDPHGVEITACGFHITGPAFNQDVPCKSLPGSGDDPVPISAEVTGLEPGGEYFVVAYATNQFNDTVEGGLEDFTTPAPPTVTLEDAGEIGSSSATLHATVDPNRAQTTCVFEYGVTPDLGLSAPCDPATLGAGESSVPVSADLAGLAPEQKYYYRISATNEAGTNPNPSEGTFETEPPSNGLPALGRCVQAPQAVTTLFKNSACTKSPTTGKSGKYEWDRWPLIKRGFTATGALTLETSTKTDVTCTASQSSGEYTGATSATLTITLTGCEAKGALSGKCQSSQTAGEIETEPLKGQLGTITAGSKPSIGWDIQPATGADLATFSCGSAQISLQGSAIAPVKSIDKMTSTLTLKFKGKKAKQTPESFEGTPKDTLTLQTPGSSEPVGLTGTLTITDEEASEIKAIE